MAGDSHSGHLQDKLNQLNGYNLLKPDLLLTAVHTQLGTFLVYFFRSTHCFF